MSRLQISTRITAALGVALLVVLVSALGWNESHQIMMRVSAAGAIGGLGSGMATLWGLELVRRSDPHAVSQGDVLALWMAGLCGIPAVWPWVAAFMH